MTDMMKAAVTAQYGPCANLRVKDVVRPLPREGEVLIRVYASSVNYSTLAQVEGTPFLARLWFGLIEPGYPIPGCDVAGRIEAVGDGVTRFKAGDDVFGDLSVTSGPGYGAFAEYVCARERALALKPAACSFGEAAASVQAALVALQALRDKGRIRAGQSVLIYGASGGIGTFAVQIAKTFGTEVTAVCGTGNLSLVRSIGADSAIDYTREDFLQNGKKYDLILATAGYRPITDYRSALAPSGIYVATGGALAQTFQAMLLGPLLSLSGDREMGNLMGSINSADLEFIKGLIESGKVKPVIDRTYSLAEAGAALAYYSLGHAKGKVVISMKEDT